MTRISIWVIAATAVIASGCARLAPAGQLMGKDLPPDILSELEVESYTLTSPSEGTTVYAGDVVRVEGSFVVSSPTPMLRCVTVAFVTYLPDQRRVLGPLRNPKAIPEGDGRYRFYVDLPLSIDVRPGAALAEATPMDETNRMVGTAKSIQMHVGARF